MLILKGFFRVFMTAVFTMILYALESFMYDEHTHMLVWILISSSVVRIIELEVYLHKKQEG